MLEPELYTIMYFIDQSFNNGNSSVEDFYKNWSGILEHFEDLSEADFLKNTAE